MGPPPYDRSRCIPGMGQGVSVSGRADPSRDRPRNRSPGGSGRSFCHFQPFNPTKGQTATVTGVMVFLYRYFCSWRHKSIAVRKRPECPFAYRAYHLPGIFFLVCDDQFSHTHCTTRVTRQTGPSWSPLRYTLCHFVMGLSSVPHQMR